MKTLFSIALLALLVIPTVNASAMTVAEFEVALAELNQQLIAFQALILDQDLGVGQVLKSTVTEDASSVDVDIDQVGQVAGVQISAPTSASTALFIVTVDNRTIFSTKINLNPVEAYTLCESHAYAFENYFKKVVCNHNSETIYDSTFIPG